MANIVIFPCLYISVYLFTVDTMGSYLCREYVFRQYESLYSLKICGPLSQVYPWLAKFLGSKNNIGGLTKSDIWPQTLRRNKFSVFWSWFLFFSTFVKGFVCMSQIFPDHWGNPTYDQWYQTVPSIYVSAKFSGDFKNLDTEIKRSHIWRPSNYISTKRNFPNTYFQRSHYNL